MYLGNYAISQGIAQWQASLFVSAIGLASIIGRLASGFLADRSWADSLVIHNVSAILAGAATCLLPALKGSASLFTFSALFGMTLCKSSFYISV